MTKETASPTRDTMVERLLRSLKYHTMNERRNYTEDAVPETYELDVEGSVDVRRGKKNNGSSLHTVRRSPTKAADAT